MILLFYFGATQQTRLKFMSVSQNNIFSKDKWVVSYVKSDETRCNRSNVGIFLITINQLILES